MKATHELMEYSPDNSIFVKGELPRLVCSVSPFGYGLSRHPQVTCWGVRFVLEIVFYEKLYCTFYEETHLFVKSEILVFLIRVRSDVKKTGQNRGIHTVDR